MFDHLARRRAGLLAVGCMAAGMLAAITAVGSSPAAADASYCRDVTFIGARGTTEPAGYGGPVGSIRTAFYNAYGSSRVASWSLDYPATANYWSSMAAGRTNLLTSIKKTVRDCPKTKFVLVGYSQGAHVVGDVVVQIGAGTGDASGIGLDRIAAVGLIGDPMFNRFNYGSMWARGQGTLHGAFGSRGQWPAALANRVVDVCIKGDPVCDSWGAATLVGLGFETTHGWYQIQTMDGTALTVTQYVGRTLATKAGWVPRSYSLPAPAVGKPAKVMATTQRMSGPDLRTTQSGWYPAGSTLTLSCFAYGQSVSGFYGGPSNLWYRTADGYFAADIDLETGSNLPITAHC